MLLAAAIERLYDLNVGITPLEEGAPHEKPHKPLLLLAAFDLIDEGLATPERIPWCQELRDRFNSFQSPSHHTRARRWQWSVSSSLRSDKHSQLPGE